MAMLDFNNPVLLLMTAVIVFLVLKLALTKLLGGTSFGRRHADFVSAIVVVAGLLMVTSVDFLQMVSAVLPYIGLGFIMIILGTLIFIAMGAKDESLMKGLKTVGGNVYLWIIVILIVAWGASMIWGQDLLESDKKANTPLTGLVTEDPEEGEFDYSFIFAKPLLGFVLLFAVLGLTFHYVTRRG